MRIRKGRLIVISGPPAGGKDSVRRELTARGYPIVLTTTSRSVRPDDLPGDYEYVSVAEFDKMVDQGLFADVSPILKGYRYGTRKSQLLKSLNEKIVWRIDPTSAANAREIVARAFELEPEVSIKLVDNIKSFWVMPESLEENERRLRLRDVHDERLLEKGLVQLKVEMDFFEAHRDKFDQAVINRRDKLEEAVDEIEVMLGWSFLISVFNFFPIDNVPPGFNVFGAAVLIL